MGGGVSVNSIYYTVLPDKNSNFSESLDDRFGYVYCPDFFPILNDKSRSLIII